MLLLLLACKGASTLDPSGVWMLQIAASTGADCDTLLSYNFLDAAPPETGTTEESTTAASDAVVMARLVGTEAGLLLMLDGGVYPEDPDADRATFSWERSEATSQTESHAAGYALTVGTESAIEQVVYLELPGKETEAALAVEGTWTENSRSRWSWEESDTWPDEVGVGETGEMPVGSYLEVPSQDTAGGTVPGSNTQWETDCLGDPCTLSVTETCTDIRALTATRTDLDPSEDGWQDAGWDAGLF